MRGSDGPLFVPARRGTQQNWKARTMEAARIDEISKALAIAHTPQIFRGHLANKRNDAANSGPPRSHPGNRLPTTSKSLHEAAYRMPAGRVNWGSVPIASSPNHRGVLPSPGAHARGKN